MDYKDIIRVLIEEMKAELVELKRQKAKAHKS